MTLEYKMNLNRLAQKHKRTVHLSGRVSPALNNKLITLAIRLGLTKSDIIRMGLEHSLPFLNSGLKVSK
jgi:hypothetical protein